MDQPDVRRRVRRGVAIGWLLLAALSWVDYGISGRAWSVFMAIAWTVLGLASIVLVARDGRPVKGVVPPDP